jgi:hypothetical protein
MCIFSGPVEEVAATSIYACEVERNVHAIAYRMQVQNRSAVAMILPVPVLHGSGDEALTFVDLSGYDDFFDDLAICAWPRGRAVSFGEEDLAPQARLTVHEVGDFVASYVPSLADFDRLDPRFRLDPTVWAKLPAYAAFGFAVFQLKPGVRTKRVHPMAYRYPADQPEELFFPTVHIHDGHRLGATAQFDHHLYYQHSPSFGPSRNFLSGDQRPGEVMGAKLDRTQGLVKPDRPITRIELLGRLRNEDHILTPAPRRRHETRLLKRGPDWKRSGRTT